MFDSDRDESIFVSSEWNGIRRNAEKALRAWKEPETGLPKLQEECGEVIAEIGKFRSGRASPAQVALELADNLMMIVQASLIVGVDVFRTALATKMARLDARLELHSLGCSVCMGVGKVAGGTGYVLCPRCFPEKPEGMPRREETKPVVPTDEFLEELFRDFREELPVKEWRRRLYDRCVGHYLRNKR
jgi:NTP pyrophosphatase (non-canonical NTP hydrolase)